MNQRNILKWEQDEPLGMWRVLRMRNTKSTFAKATFADFDCFTGELATISPVLYANMKHNYLKKEFPDWPTRAKQVAKLWRKATPDERAPYLVSTTN